jgi:hypothetical protein
MFNVVANAVTNPSSVGANSVGSILRGITDPHPEEEGICSFLILLHLPFVLLSFSHRATRRYHASVPGLCNHATDARSDAWQLGEHREHASATRQLHKNYNFTSMT